MTNSDIGRAYKLIDHLLVGPQPPLSSKYYYVNYSWYEGKIVARWVETEEELYVGPYPHPIAEVVKVLVGRMGLHRSGYSTYAHRITLSLKPRKGSRKTTGPTRDEIESYLLGSISSTLLVYKGLQDWYITNTGEQI